MKVGNLYEHIGTGEQWKFIEHCLNTNLEEREALFRSVEDGRSLFFDLSQMKPVSPEVETEFELDEEIECSEHFYFDDFEVLKYKHKNPRGSYWGIDKKGMMRCKAYARKIVKPKLNIDGILYTCTESQKNKHDYLTRELESLRKLVMELSE